MKKLHEVLTIRHGRNQKEVEVRDGLYPILGTGGEIGRTNSFLYDKPSVLIGRKGTIDKPRYMDTPFWTVDTLFYSAIKAENSAKFMFYVFNTIDWRQYNEASGVPSLSASTISSIKVNVPLKPEQERIATVLETWDNYLELLDKKIALKEQLKKGLMHQLLTGRVRLPGFDKAWSNLGFGELYRTLPKPAGLKSEKYFKQGAYEIFDQSKDNYVSGYSDNEELVVTLKEPVILFGDHSRVVKYIPASSVLFGNDGVKIFQATPGNDPYYSYLVLATQRVPNTGYNRHFKYISDLDLEVPGLEEQKAISERISLIENQIQLLNKKRTAMNQQKEYLLKKLVTGTIRTPENLKLMELQHA